MYPADLKSLTGLRIVAAGWVLVYHFRNRLGLDLEHVGLIDKGYLGVDLFFILSGFILSHVYMTAWAEGRFRYGSFLWARLARLYPVHLLTLAATIGLWALGRWAGARFEAAAFDPAAIPQHLLLIHAWWATPTVQWNFPPGRSRPSGSPTWLSPPSPWRHWPCANVRSWRSFWPWPCSCRSTPSFRPSADR
ncbi:acyltransferase family protein [Caulobacter segnis]